MSVKRRSPVLPSKPKEEGNKKAILVLGLVVAAIIIVVSILIVVSG